MTGEEGSVWEKVFGTGQISWEEEESLIREREKVEKEYEELLQDLPGRSGMGISVGGTFALSGWWIL